MATIINRNDAPRHLFNIPELDLSGDLFAERPDRPWFRLGAWTRASQRDARGVEDVVSRQSLLLASDCLIRVFDDLGSIGNVLTCIGQPGGPTFCEADEKKSYRYAPFHRFELPFTSVVAEPLVFVHYATSGARLFLNPDLWLFFELEEKTRGNGIWWDPRRGVDTIIHRLTDERNLEVVDIRVDYLLKYLKARQMSLVVGHYRHLYLVDPPDSTMRVFVEGDVSLGSPEQGAKALLRNWQLRQDYPDTALFLCRRLDLWFEIRPPEIDAEDPLADEPPFDHYTFTLPTSVGPVAPAHWRHFRHTEGRTFEGEVCDFMDRVCFRQEVLTKYEGASGFDVGDDGSVSCHHYWGLIRGVARIGNELLVAAIGDFAQGVPFEEWPHWKQYAVEPPSPESVEAIRQEESVPGAVNSLVKALDTLNAAFADMGDSLALTNLEPLWRGSLDSLPARQLKWVYPASADDDEFLKRAMLTSTLVIEEFDSPPLRKVLLAVGNNLHMDDQDPPRPLASRNLLQRLTLIAILTEEFRPQIKQLPILAKQAERKAAQAGDVELQAELTRTYQRVRDEFAPLAFLYDLRTHGGLAHKLHRPGAAKAAAQLGLPEKSWHRIDYLRLLNLIENSVRQIGGHLETGAQVIVSGGLPDSA